MKADSAHVGLHFDKNAITLNPITASFYQGTISGTANGHDVATAPVWQWDMQLNQVQVQPLLQDVNTSDSKLTIAGTAAIKFKASTWGVGKASLINNLNGTLDISVVKGVITGIDLNYLLKTADALLNKGDVAKPTDINQTPFDSFTANVDIKNGLAETNNLLVSAPGFTTKGNGSVNLPYQAINFQLQVAPAKEARTQWIVPVLIAGNFNHPDIRLDMTEVNKFLVKQGTDKLKDKVRDEIKKKVPGQAGEMLQHLLGS
jgi:AsmA protein